MAANNLFRSPIGGMMGGFEDFETERAQSSPSNNNQSNNTNNSGTSLLNNAFLSAPADLLTPAGGAVVDLAKSSTDAFIDLGKTIFGLGEKTDQKFSSKGSIDNFQNPTPEQNKKNQEAQIKRTFYSAIEEDRRNVRVAKSEKAMQDAVRLEVAAMSVTDKLDTLHLNLDLDEKHINDPYHINELRRKKLAQLKKAKEEQLSQDMAQVTKKGNGLFLNQSAQEGQSMASASGAIMSAG